MWKGMLPEIHQPAMSGGSQLLKPKIESADENV